MKVIRKISCQKNKTGKEPKIRNKVKEKGKLNPRGEGESDLMTSEKRKLRKKEKEKEI